MTITLSHAGTSIVPAIVNGYRTTKDTTNVVHPTISGRVVVTVGPTLPRAGTLELIFDSRATAFAALDLHSDPGVFQLIDSDMPQLDMVYAVTGSLDLERDTNTLDSWIIRVPFQETS